ncbi:helix-turn-helix domain-containing protein [Rhodococcus aetherivorans]|uniref:helix-turn-helix domain-containing protein n=1 Tax=Rhodococcus aetherivorans TaxID=191292 RepID=UPI001E5F8529|nr:helix-turn-helix domain-containing protein [Rhodococcus aetherivorans]UGQ43396.1 helix-turn-helix domain-containing protein [Rhodococcus aetherivorans]
MSMNDVLDLDELRRQPTTSVTRAAEFLGVSRATAYTMAREGTLPTVDLGGRRYRVKSAALLRMLEG